MSDCIACGEPNDMEDGKTKLATFDPFGDGDPQTCEAICRDCCILAVAAWARKDKGDNAEKPTPGTPTGSPAGAMPATAVAVAA